MNADWIPSRIISYRSRAIAYSVGEGSGNGTLSFEVDRAPAARQFRFINKTVATLVDARIQCM